MKDDNKPQLPREPAAKPSSTRSTEPIIPADVEPSTVPQSASSELRASSAASPQATSSAPQSSLQPRNRSKKPFIIAGILSVVLALFIGAGALAYTLYQKPENVLLEAVSKALAAQKVSSKTEITSDYSYTSSGVNVKFKKLTIDTGAEFTPKYSANAELVLEINGMDITLKAGGLVMDDGTVYFKVDDLVSTVKKVATLYSEEELPDSVLKPLGKIDGKWTKYSIADVRKDSGERANQMQCILDTYKKYAADTSKHSTFANIYKEHQFIVIDKEVAAKDGNLGYSVSLDASKTKSFLKAAADTEFSKDLKDCTSSTDTGASANTDDIDQAVDDARSSTDLTATVWVSQWTHELRSIDVSVKNIDAGTGEKYSLNSTTKLDFTKGVTANAPSDAMSAEEWAENVGQAFQAVSSIDLSKD